MLPLHVIVHHVGLLSCTLHGGAAHGLQVFDRIIDQLKPPEMSLLSVSQAMISRGVGSKYNFFQDEKLPFSIQP